MPSTRRSPRGKQEHPFRPRVETDRGDAFWLRQSLRCRDELVRLSITILLQAALLVAFVLFGRTAWRLFHSHARTLPGWLSPLLLGATAVAVLLSLRRLVLLVRQWRATRADYHDARNRLGHPS